MIPVPRRFCPACEIAVAEEEAERERTAAREAVERRRLARLEELAVPSDFEDAAVDRMLPWGSDRQRERLANAVHFARRIIGEVTNGLRPPPFVAFIGRPGNGKTRLMWAIARDLTGSYGRHTRVVRLSELVRDLRANWGGKGSTVAEERRLRYWANLDFLGIDECTKEALYGNPKQHLLELISLRIDRRKPTVVTSNNTLDQLESFLGPALMSRLAMGGMVDFGWDEDFRQLASDERPRGA